MFEVKLKNLSNVVSWEARFPTYQEALVWTQKQLPKEGRLQGDPDDFIEDITAQHEAEQIKIQRIKDGAKARSTCQSVLDFVAGYNIERNLTVEQIGQMQNDFGAILSLLLASRPSSAKTLIQSANVDGIIITQELIDNCLQLLADY